MYGNRPNGSLKTNGLLLIVKMKNNLVLLFFVICENYYGKDIDFTLVTLKV
jgi:hypothetical protein